MMRPDILKSNVPVRIKRGGRLLLPLCLFMLISACTGESANIEDLRNFTQSVRAREKPEIDPLPAVVAIELFQYTAASKVSPFSVANVLPEVQTTLEVDPVLPDQGRSRQPLEYFALDSLKMVGTLKQNNIMYAVVFAPDNTVHRVTRGNYAGTQSGKIVSISDAEIVLEENVRVGRGGWKKRKVSIAISDKK